MVTIADLNQPFEVRSALFSRAMEIKGYYDKWKSLHEQGYGYYVDTGKSGERRPGIHASELNCMRRMTYTTRDEAYNPNGDVDLNMMRRFDIGKAIHAMTQTEFELMCDWVNQHAGQKVLTFEREVKIAPHLQPLAQKYNIHSHCDGIWTFWHEDEPYLRVLEEIKTKSGPEFEKLNQPDEDHQEQICLYQAVLDVPIGHLHYYNKSNSNITKSEDPWMFPFNHKLWAEKLEPRIVDVLNHVANKTLPDRSEGMHCGWCKYAKTCGPRILNAAPTSVGINAGAFQQRVTKWV